MRTRADVASRQRRRQIEETTRRRWSRDHTVLCSISTYSFRFLIFLFFFPWRKGERTRSLVVVTHPAPESRAELYNTRERETESPSCCVTLTVVVGLSSQVLSNCWPLLQSAYFKFAHRLGSNNPIISPRLLLLLLPSADPSAGSAFHVPPTC